MLWAGISPSVLPVVMSGSIVKNLINVKKTISG